MADFKELHWFLKDLKYTYLDDGFTLVAYTDVPCHLYARMTTKPPRKHALPSYRRGLFLQGDIRFCFVVYEDNEQAEVGDTLVHTFAKSAWPICETRWFYFVGTIAGLPSVSESPIFKFHFPAPPPEPPPPLDAYFFGTASNRTIRSNAVDWGSCRSGNSLVVGNWHNAPLYRLLASSIQTATFWITRSFLFFDTSTLPGTARVLSGELRLYGQIANKTSSAAYPYIQVTKGYQSDPPVIGDWAGQTDETQVLAQFHLDSIIISGYNDFPLNQGGLDHVNLTGITRYCIRQEMDVRNVVPPLGANELAYWSQQKGAGWFPMLHVQYYPA